MKKLRKILLWIVLFFFGSTILSVLIFKWVPVYYTPLMLIRSIEHKVGGTPAICEHHWVPLDSISPNLPIAVMASEDQLFLRHSGFDEKAIRQAMEDNKKGKRLRGGSTISQQTAKNVFLWPGRSWIRKGLEAYFTLLIEFIWGKDRIMEVYLNSIEMGQGIYGAEAVAQEHFGKHAHQLTREQCALIAASLPNPLVHDSQHPDAYLLKHQKRILKQMSNIGSWWTKRHESKEPAEHTNKKRKR